MNSSLNVLVTMPYSIHYMLKRLAFEQDSKVSRVIREAVIEKYGQPTPEDHARAIEKMADKK